ncbi:MAG: purine-nucleoside phosphorylase [Ruminococcus sp.]|nr:purine-nucleoside phosphorylase [Ruminococcus sp.]
MATPHNQANRGEIAKTVLMPGDPLRAKWIAETFLTDPYCYNTTRNMLGYTGTYQGIPISVQGSGMGIPSIGIYSYELFTEYEVDRILRVGTAGGIHPSVQLRDIVLGQGACTDSNYAAQYHLPGTFAPIASFALLEQAAAAARAAKIPVHIGNLLSSDVFYAEQNTFPQWQRMGVLAVEMEAAGLYLNAARTGKQALCLATISDLPLTGTATSAEERQTTFRSMIQVALDTAVRAAAS